MSLSKSPLAICIYSVTIVPSRCILVVLRIRIEFTSVFKNINFLGNLIFCIKYFVSNCFFFNILLEHALLRLRVGEDSYCVCWHDNLHLAPNLLFPCKVSVEEDYFFFVDANVICFSFSFFISL